MSFAITGSVAAQQLAQALVGAGVTISNVTYTGNALQAGTFTGGLSAGGVDQTGKTGIGFDSGIILSSGTAANTANPQTPGRNDTSFEGAGDPILTTQTGQQTYDASVLEFDFNPGDATQVFFNFVFGTDEYPASPSFNDGFLILVNGTNVAKIPGNTSPVQLSNFSQSINKQYYKDATAAGGNPSGFPTQVINAEIESMSVVLQSIATVLPNQTNHIKFAVADAGDSAVDSFVLVQGGSLSTTPVSVTPTPTLMLAPASDSGTLGDRITNIATPLITGTGTAGDTITLFDGSTQIGSATIAVDGTWSVTASALTQGSHSLSATQTDGTTTSPASTALSLTIDSSPPASPADLALAPVSDSNVLGDGLTNDGTPTLTGSAEAGSAVTLVDTSSGSPVVIGTTVANGTGLWSYTPTTALDDGVHTIAATARDAAGNVSPSSSILALTIDTTAPATAADLTLAPGSDSGTPGDRLTNIASPVITGTGAAGASLALYEGKTLVGTTVVASDGTWSVTPTSALDDGVHSFDAITTDAAGNVSPNSSVLAVTIDTTAPEAAAALTLAPGSDSGTPGDGLTNNVNPVITGIGVAGDVLALYEGETLVGTTVVASDGTWLVTPGTALGDGVHSFAAITTDAAGNVSPRSSVLAVTIDTTAPTTVSDLALAPDSDSGTPGDGLTNIATPVITGTGAAGDFLTLYEGGTLVGTTVVASDGTWSVTPGTALGDGAHSFAAITTDVAGNASPRSSVLAVTIDTTAPEAAADLSLAPDSDSGTPGDGLTNIATPVITGTGAAGDVLVLYEGDALVGTTVVASDGTWSVTPATALGDGAHSFAAITTDAAGNVSPRSSVLTVTIDTAVPETAADLTLAPASDSGTPGDGLTNVARPVITGTGVAGDVLALYEGDNLVGTTVIAPDGTWSVTPATALGDGAHSFAAITTDAAGNVSPRSSVLAVTVDTTAPEALADLTLAPDSDSGTLGDRLTNDADPVITGTGSAGDVLTLYEGETLLGTTIVAPDGTWSVAPGTALGDGVHSFAATATDAAGNVSPRSSVLAVTIDTTAPASAINLALAPASDSGTLGDGVTNVAKPVITGVGSTGDTITLFDGDVAIGTGTVTDGVWSIVTTTALTEGPNSITAIQSDAAGNVSAPSAALNVTLVPDNFNILGTGTNITTTSLGDAYTGPIAGIEHQYVVITNENLNITALVPNVFIHSGSGTDGIDVGQKNGNNVLDGGAGSTFFTGGTGNDTFYIDERTPQSAPVFSTIVNFHPGDNATVWGVNATDFAVLKLDNQGAAGFTGLDFIFSAPGHTDTSFLLAGYTSTDLTNGRLSASYGTTPDLPGLPGSQYLTIHAN